MSRSRPAPAPNDPDAVDDWLASVAETHGLAGLVAVRDRLASALEGAGANLFATPYRNTIAAGDEPDYPGDADTERWLTALQCFNAIATVTRANRRNPGLGGHISTYTSAATLMETAFHHVIRADDFVYFQGHASPGIYARAFLEGRLSAEELDGFRQEAGGSDGLSSYPHPRLMPEFWDFPTVSMGIGPLSAVYQARFLRYARDRELVDDAQARRVWCFVGDGECDEPETRAGLTLAGRARLSNLAFVINCNLQRLDGPVRSNHKVVQELEGLFAGCGWRVIKVLWGSGWDRLFDSDRGGALVERLGRMVNGEIQRLAAAPVERLTDELFTGELAELIDGWSEEHLRALEWGGHDCRKVYAAYAAALDEPERPTVILAQTVKGHGLGAAGRAWNSTHKISEVDDELLAALRSDLDLETTDDPSAYAKPADESSELEYLRERRRALGGPVPRRRVPEQAVEVPALEPDSRLLQDSGNRQAATTMAATSYLDELLGGDIGERIVPIIADEGRTFGLDGLFAKYGIYSPVEQRYEPVDADSLQYYREEQSGQILQEGITEAGAMASFLAAGTAYASLGYPMVPFYLFYSMFGFQRVGDLIWAAADARARGFLLGCTAGRTTLSGEGLQHQDGHSQLLAATLPSVRAYDAAFAYEVAVIIEHGLQRLLTDEADEMFYLTLYNEKYTMPELPDGAADDIVAGMHRVAGDEGADVVLLGSGPIVRECLEAARLLRELADVRTSVFSVTSYQQLRRDALRAEHHNRKRGDEAPRLSHIDRLLGRSAGPFVAASDWMSLVPEQIARFLPGPMRALGTDGYGRSDTRAALRRFFGIDAPSIARAAMESLADQGRVAPSAVERMCGDLGLDGQASRPAPLSERNLP